MVEDMMTMLEALTRLGRVYQDRASVRNVELSKADANKKDEMPSFFMAETYVLPSFPPLRSLELC